MEPLIFDTSAILNFGHRGELDALLQQLTGTRKLLTTPEVVQELRDPQRLSFYHPLIQKYFKVEAAQGTKMSLHEFSRLASVLGPGELSVIQLASDLGGIAVLDETLARAEALKSGILVTGTLGLLADGLKKCWHTDAECVEIVVRLHTNGFRVRRPGANESFAEYIQSITG